MELPGIDIQHRMAAVERLAELQETSLKAQQPKRAAVMMLIYPKNHQPHFVLIERMQSPGAHSGQIAFPGGRREPEDRNDQETAIRETFEEVGVSQQMQQVICSGTPVYIPPSNYLVSPYLAFAKAQPTFTPQPEEVQSIIEVPLADLLSQKYKGTATLSTSYMKEVEVPCYRLNKQVVWGATAMMLAEFEHMIKQA